ncbi:MAG: hypothetical protein J1F12_06370 [Muribaculaceae bacterium]|nr:hypothetical protein [Muribaculaceae bacterium]
MSRTLIFSILLFACLSVSADRKADYNNLGEILQRNGLQIQENMDTVVDYKGYPVRIISKQGNIEHIGLNLFNPEWKNVIDKDLLNYIERDLLMQVATEKYGEDSLIEFKLGSLSDLKRIDSNKPCNITTMDASLLSIDWTTDNGKPILISAPVSYEILRGATRAEIETDFLSQLKKSNFHRNVDIEIDRNSLQPYGETEYIVPGGYYINDKITRNLYLNSDGESFIWDSRYPLESLSNLFIGGAGNSDAEVDLTVMKHEYGEKEQIQTGIENLLAVAEVDGCIPYWGLESYENGKLTGTVFLYNPGQGYDHILKIECLPEEIIAGNGKMKAKAYLYVPSNNVSNLNEPYRVKTEDEKIKYWDN